MAQNGLPSPRKPRGGGANQGATRTYQTPFTEKKMSCRKKDKIQALELGTEEFFCTFGFPVSQNSKKGFSEEKNRDFAINL